MFKTSATTTMKVVPSGDSPITEKTALFAASSSSSSGATTDPNSNDDDGDCTIDNNKDSVNNANTTIETEDYPELWEELDQPWPSTLKRSIVLLSTPGIDRRSANLSTLGPKPGRSPTAIIRRKSAPSSRRSSSFHYCRQAGNKRNKSWGGTTKSTGGGSVVVVGSFITKSIQGLLFHDEEMHDDSEYYDSIRRTESEEMRLAQAAKDYRVKILQKVQGGGGGGGAAADYEPHIEYPEKEQSPECHEGKATFIQCVFNLSNILMGVGILGLPYAYRSAGWYGGTFCVIAFGLVTWRTSILIGRELNGDPRPSASFVDSPFNTPHIPGSSPEARMYSPITSFPDIAQAAFGRVGCIILSIMLYFEIFSCVSVAFVTIGDHMHTLLPSIPASHHMVTMAGLTLIPTTFLRTPAVLSYLSMLGTFATVSVVLSVVIAAFVEGDISEEVAVELNGEEATANHIGWRNSGLVIATGIVAYCFSGHAIVPTIYASMERPQNFEMVVHTTFVVVITCCLAVGISGYLMFGAVVQDEITLSLEHTSLGMAMDALVCLMIMTCFSKITLRVFPLALGIEEIISPYLTGKSMVDATLSLIKIMITISTVLVALFMPSFGFICALVGMVCAMSVSVIFPAGAHLAMFGDHLSIGEKIIDWTFVIFGFLVAIVGTYTILNQDP